MVDTVKVEVIVPLAIGVTDPGAKPHVTVAFAGVIEHVNPTIELKPLKEVTVIVEFVLFPAGVVAETGDALRLKSFTVNA